MPGGGEKKLHPQKFAFEPAESTRGVFFWQLPAGGGFLFFFWVGVVRYSGAGATRRACGRSRNNAWAGRPGNRRRWFQRLSGGNIQRSARRSSSRAMMAPARIQRAVSIGSVSSLGLSAV